MDHQTIITDLGGIRALARKLGHNSHTTVQAWFDRNRIPLDRWEEVLSAAKASNVKLRVRDLLPEELRGAAA